MLRISPRRYGASQADRYMSFSKRVRLAVIRRWRAREGDTCHSQRRAQHGGNSEKGTNPFLWGHTRVDGGQRRGLIGRCATRRQRLPDSASCTLTHGVTARGASSAANASVPTNPATAQIAQDVRPAKLRRVSINCLRITGSHFRGGNNKPFLMAGKVTELLSLGSVRPRASRVKRCH